MNNENFGWDFSKLFSLLLSSRIQNSYKKTISGQNILSVSCVL